MKLPIAVHTVTTSYGTAQIGTSDELGPERNCIEGIFEKVLEELVWTGEYDRHLRGIRKLEDVANRVMEHNLHGRSWVPWGNVLGNAAELEGRQAAAVALTAHGAQTQWRRDAFIPTFIANVEPYEQFWIWRGIESEARAETWVRSYAEAGGKALWMWIDARSWQLTSKDGIGFDEWKHAAEKYGLVFQVLPETYWTAFSGSLAHAEPALRTVVEELEARGMARGDIMPTLPGDAEPDDMVKAIMLCKDMGLAKPNVWQRMNLRVDTAKAIAAMDDPWGEATDGVPAVPEPDLDAIGAGVDHRIDAIRGAAQGIADSAQKLVEALR